MSTPTHNDTNQPTTLTIVTERNQPLTASLYLPKDSDSDSVKNAIMIAPATGIKRVFIITSPVTWPRKALALLLMTMKASATH